MPEISHPLQIRSDHLQNDVKSVVPRGLFLYGYFHQHLVGRTQRCQFYWAMYEGLILIIIVVVVYSANSQIEIFSLLDK